MQRFSRLALIAAALSLAPAARAGGPASAHYARGAAGVFWFMHISDLHTSCDWNPTDEHKNMELVFGEANQVVKPWFLVATGDLVDGSPYGVPTTGQSQAEWDEYKGLYTAAGLTPMTYFDLPGNHDGYGDVGFNFYQKNSLQGSTNQSTYVSWVVDTPLGSYQFFGLDSAGEGSGPFAEQPEFLQSQIDAMKTDLLTSPAPELVFVLAHHPITTPKNSGQVVDFMKTQGGGFYLHGHVHQYKEYTDGDPTIVVNEVDTLGQSGSANIAVGAVDHNAFVYRVTGSKKPWPMVVITAPVSNLLRDAGENPFAYPVCKDRKDNPVRALVFAKETVTEVVVEVGSLAPVPMVAAGQPDNLWLAEVDTSALSPGSTDVRVTATANGETNSHTISTVFVDGPCDPLPEDPGPDAGTDAGTETDAGAAGAGGSAGSSPLDGSAAAAGMGGAAGAEPTAEPEDGGDDSGCACRQSPAPGRNSGAGWLIAISLIASWRSLRRTAREKRGA